VGIQDKISKAQVSVRRKLRDYKIEQSGFEGQVIRLKTDVDMYDDETITLISDDVITLSLDLPEKIPYTRLRQNVTEAPATTENLFLYEILPISGYAKFTDNIEKGDILIHKIYDDVHSAPYLFILRVSELIATVSIRHITSREFQCSPYNMPLPVEVQDLITQYEGA